MQNEIWKTIKDFEDYEISNYGVVRRIRYSNIQYKHKKTLPYYIKPRFDKDGYTRYALCKDGKIKQAFAHRLVCQAFIPNPNNYPVINHKDCNIKNNYVENLEWCTIKYNNNYIEKMGRRNICYGAKHPNSKVVLMYDKDYNFIREFESSGEASRFLGIPSSAIRNCCNPNNKYIKHKDYIFQYKENQ